MPPRVFRDVGVDGRRQRWEEVLVAHLLGEAAALELHDEIVFHPGHRERDPALGKRCSQALQGVQRRQVHLGDGLRVQDEPLRLADALVQCGECATLEVGGVGEEQWTVVAVNDEPLHLGGRGVIVDVVHAGPAGDVPEHPVVGVADAAQQVGDRQDHGDDDPGEHIEGDHTDGGGERQSEFTEAEVPEPPQLPDVDEPQRGVDDDGAEGGRREGRQH